MGNQRDREIEQLLYSRLEEAKFAHAAAKADFDSILNEGMGVLPPPDGAHRVAQAGSEFNDALRRHMNALREFTAFITKGIIPEDMKPPK